MFEFLSKIEAAGTAVRKNFIDRLFIGNLQRKKDAAKPITDITQPIQHEEKKMVEVEELASDLTDQEISHLNQLIKELTSVKQNEMRTWGQLSEHEQELLIKRYGQPTESHLEVVITGRTKGEGCADNDRGLPSSFESNNFGVLENQFLFFSLYGQAPQIPEHTKVRLVPARLTICRNGTLLFPDFFYT